VQLVTPPRLARAFGALALAAAMAAGAQAALWVSPAGDDRNPGTEEEPLRTIERARDVVRTLNRDMADDLTVFVAGEIHVSRPIEFGPEDSGSNGFNIVYTSAPGEHPLITGGLRVVGWTLADKARGLWSAPAPADLEDTRDLFVNGTPVGRTRSRLLQVFAKDASADAPTSPDPTAQWKNPDDVVFEPAGDEGIWSGRTGTLPVFVENAFELLGTPGQWYFDRPARRIYYTPRPGEDMATADVEAAAARALVIGLGTMDRPIAGLVFKGFRFEYTTWHFSPDDQPTAQAEPRWAAVSFNYATGIQFLEDEFLHMSSPALDLGPHVDGSIVEGCLFGDIGWSAIRLSQASGIRVEDSRLSYVADAHVRRGAIEVDRSRDVVIDRDQIDHFPSAAILAPGEASGDVRGDSNRISAPMIGFHGAKAQGPDAAPSADAGISQDYRALTGESFASPTLPNPPTEVAAEAEDGFAYLTWIPNCQDGGSPVVSYVVTTSGGTKPTVPAQALEEKGYVVVDGLDNGQAVSFTVAAVNAQGTGAPSLPTASVKAVHKRRLKAPAPPAAVSITTGREGSVLVITPPPSDGGSPVVSYSVVAGPGAAPLVIEGLDVVHSDAAHPVRRTLAGLAPAPGATVSVVATNAFGDGKPAAVVLK
jgi:hypothetical protein